MPKVVIGGIKIMFVTSAISPTQCPGTFIREITLKYYGIIFVRPKSIEWIYSLVESCLMMVNRLTFISHRNLCKLWQTVLGQSCFI